MTEQTETTTEQTSEEAAFEIQQLQLVELKKISGYLKFFVVLTVIGLILAFIVALL